MVTEQVGTGSPPGGPNDTQGDGAMTDQRERDLDVLATIGRMYLDALDADPDNEMLTLPEAMGVTEGA